MSKGQEKLKESLSALMDNEVSEFEFRRILKESEANPELKQKWERFHMLSAAIRGELDNRINAGLPIVSSEADKSGEKRPDLLARINAELDGVARDSEGGSDAASSALTYTGGANTDNTDTTSIFKRLGQGAIAASVAAIVLIAGGSLNSSQPFGTEMQMAEQTQVVEESVPQFNDAYSPSQFSRVPQFNTEVAGTESTDDAARVRLRQAVFQEFVGEPQESLELPVNFSVIIEEE